MNSLKGIIAVGIAVWLLFLGGCDALQRATNGYTANGVPIVPAIQTGVERVLATPKVTFSTPVIIVPQGMPSLPRATPQPVQGQAQAQPTNTPGAVEPQPAVDVQATADKEATIQAWLQAPPATATPSPGPGDPGFAESFATPVPCSPFIGYIGPKKAECDAVYATQTAVAKP